MRCDWQAIARAWRTWFVQREPRRAAGLSMRSMGSGSLGASGRRASRCSSTAGGEPWGVGPGRSKEQAHLMAHLISAICDDSVHGTGQWPRCATEMQLRAGRPARRWRPGRHDWRLSEGIWIVLHGRCPTTAGPAA